MNEEQFLPVSRTACLIFHALCSATEAAASPDLQRWLLEHPANQLLIDELNEPDTLYQELVNYSKFNTAERLDKATRRLFGDDPSATQEPGTN